MPEPTMYGSKPWVMPDLESRSQVLLPDRNLKNCPQRISFSSRSNSGEPQQLYGAYKRSLELAVKHNCHSIGFPLISAGIFGYPKDKAWRKAIQACKDFLDKHPDMDLEIVFAVLDDGTLALGQKSLAEIVGN